MANIDLEEFARKLKLIKIVAPSRQWQSWSVMDFSGHKGFYDGQ